MLARTLLDEPLLLGRARDGKPFALVDRCPHRAMPLSHGGFDGAEIECCYHGWRFNSEGRCTAIPSLVDGAQLELSRIRAKRYPCRELQGNIWVYFGAEDGPLPEPPTVPEIGDRPPRLSAEMIFPCHVDHAVVGLMDPAHGPFVHRSWWWRSRRSIHEKARRFEPAPLGFRMVRHRPSSNSAGYKLLGGVPTTEITFSLPGVRVEHVSAGRHTLCGLTAVTPIGARETLVTHAIYWTMPWLTPLKLLLRPFARAFLEQDRRIVEMQQEGLKGDPPLILIDDADTQAKWYYRLKKEYARAQAEGTPFQNPVPERTLRWRS
jgi:phenylpropionate dioxygenase-like ring-hydroxylating dioxygenase large terminal subunit